MLPITLTPTTPRTAYGGMHTWLNELDARYNQEFYITDYGAVGDSDGTGSTGTNNTSAVQAAINAAHAAGGGVVIIPRGTFRCHSAVAQWDDVAFDGPGTLYFDYTGTPSGTGVYIENANPGPGNFILAMRNITILGPATTHDSTDPLQINTAVYMAGVTDLVLTNVTFSHLPGISLQLAGVTRGRIHGCKFLDGIRDGIHLNVVGGPWNKPCTDVIVTDCIINYLGDDAIVVNSASGLIATGIIIANNAITHGLGDANATGSAIVSRGMQHSIIANNKGSDSNNCGVMLLDSVDTLVHTDNVLVSGNELNRIGIGDTNDAKTGILAINATNITIDGGSIKSAGVYSHGVWKNGIRLDGCTNVKIGGGLRLDTCGLGATDYSVVVLNSSVVNIEHIDVRNGSAAGIYWDNSSGSIEGCHLQNNGTARSGATDKDSSGILIVNGGAKTLKYLNNTIIGHTYSIAVKTGGTAIGFWELMGNEFSGFATAAVLLEVNPTAWAVARNKGLRGDGSDFASFQVNADYVLTLLDVCNAALFLLVDASGGNIVITLPPAALAIHRITLMRVAGANTITLTRSGAPEVIYEPGGTSPTSVTVDAANIYKKVAVESYNGVQWIQVLRD